MQRIDQETPLRRWWRDESWVDLQEDPSIQPMPLAEAVALAEWVAESGKRLDANTNYSGCLQAFIQADVWEEHYAELAFAVATASTLTQTPYSVISRLFELVYQRAKRRELCVRVRRNQGAVANYTGDADAVFAYTRDVMSLLPEADPHLRPGVEVSVYIQRSWVLLHQRKYDQALNHALQGATLANYHAGGKNVVESIYGHLALCAGLDDRLDMAQAWLERLVDPTTQGRFVSDVVRSVLHHRRGETEAAMQLACQTLALWPHHVVRRPNVYVSGVLVDIIEHILLSRGVEPHDIDPELI